MLNKKPVFRPTASETKADSVSRIVKGMTDAENSARQAKTQRLRAARLERDLSEKAVVEKGAKKKSRNLSSKSNSPE
ncbi:hypothetical protein [Palleronia salina]|uniref:hypothetical protein n=1 Tax=Palleronia salina TaxID=313368 RepID=UPI001114BDB3|nr:hypothetical protein [Palleronia salina]